MEAAKIIDSNLLDILFEGKNKAYGAYELRKNYNYRITIAIIGMTLICILFFLTQILGSHDKNENKTIAVSEVSMENLKEPKEKIPDLPKIEPKEIIRKVEVNRFATPVITEDKAVTETPPTIDELEQSQIGLFKQEGVKDESYSAPPAEAKSTGILVDPKKDDEDYEKLFLKVEKEASFPGGLSAWKKYLERNLNAAIAADEGAPTGSYTVKVQFVVDKEGRVKNAQAVEVPSACPGCGVEAVKVIAKGPAWEPAVQNGRKVIYQAFQSITFQVAEE